MSQNPGGYLPPRGYAPPQGYAPPPQGYQMQGPYSHQPQMSYYQQGYPPPMQPSFRNFPMNPMQPYYQPMNPMNPMIQSSYMGPTQPAYYNGPPAFTQPHTQPHIQKTQSTKVVIKDPNGTELDLKAMSKPEAKLSNAPAEKPVIQSPSGTSHAIPVKQPESPRAEPSPLVEKAPEPPVEKVQGVVPEQALEIPKQVTKDPTPEREEPVVADVSLSLDGESSMEKESSPSEAVTDSGKKKPKKKGEFALPDAEEPFQQPGETEAVLDEDGEIVDEGYSQDGDQQEEYAEPYYTVADTYQKTIEYKEGMWSPENQEGSKDYPLSFLMQFSFYEEKPTDFQPPPGFGVPEKIIQKINYPRPTERVARPSYPPRVANNVRPNPKGSQGPLILPMPNPRGPTMHQMRPPINMNNIRGGRYPITPVHMEPVEPLKVSENRWVRPTNDTDEVSLASRTYRGLLNKLTVEKFDTITEEILKHPIESVEVLIELIRLLFEKATDEANFSSIYANLCSRIMAKVPTFENNNFRRLILNKCQQEFEKKADEEVPPLTDEQKKSMTEEEIEEYQFKRAKIKRRVLGNITFIGELYKLGMLTSKIIDECIVKLLHRPEERDVECLCNLLKTVGKSLDNQEHERQLNMHFERMAELSHNDSLSSRIRFLLLDIIDLRKNKWVPRREEVKAKKIEEVRLEAQQEEARKNAANARASSDNRRSSSGRGGYPSLMQQNALKHEAADLSKLGSFSSQKSPGTTHLGPPSFRKNQASAGAPSGSTTFGAPRLASPPSEPVEDSPKTPTKEQPPATKKPESATKEQPSRTLESFMTVMKNNRSEYLDTHDLKSAILDFKELAGNEKYHSEMVKTFLEESLGSTVKDISRLFAAYLSAGLVSQANLANGIDQVLEFLDDLLIDIPGLVDEIGVVLIELVTAGNASVAILKDLTHLGKQANGPKVLVSFFKGLVAKQGEQQVGAQVEAVGGIASLVPSSISEKLTPWLADNGLGFLVPRIAVVYSREVLSKIVEEQKGDPALKWIAENVSEEIRNSKEFAFDLMTSVIMAIYKQTKHGKKADDQEKQLLLSYHDLLARFLSGSQELQVEAIYAIQAHWATHEYPPKLMARYLSQLYTYHVLEEKALVQWKHSIDHRHSGKKQALEDTRNVFSFLEHATPVDD